MTAGRLEFAMHYTRRLLERRWSGALVVASLTSAGAVASCASSDEEPPAVADVPDAAPSAPSVPDATVPDAPEERDAAPFDGGPLPVVCAGTPCAMALVTTRGAGVSDRGEGFCVLLHDGAVACWGAGGAGQLGRGAEAGVGDSASPERVSGLTEIVALDHTCAVDKAGAAYCWGTGPFLRSTSAATTTERTPVKLDIPSVTKVAVGVSTGCALSDGRVLCWGSNVNAQIAPLESQAPSAVLPVTERALPEGAAVRDLAVGDATFAIRVDGTVVTWGANPPLARVSSLPRDPYPMPSLLVGVTTIDLAEDNACTTVAGVGQCWGTIIARESELQQGVKRLDRALPNPVATPEPVVQIATTRPSTAIDPVPVREGIGWSAPVQPQRWCAIGASGAVYCWGYNASGQAGDGTKEFAYRAVKVVGLPEPAAQVRTTADATCALLTTGKVYCWGTNYYGQLGNGTIRIPSLTPQEVVLP